MILKYDDFANSEELNKILKKLTDNLDITPTQYEDATNKYQAIANYLKNDNNIAILDPDMYPQGSFNLGTVIKPDTDKDEFDIDLVCELRNVNSKAFTQEDLKNLIGDSLKKGAYRDKLKDLDGSRRCWTIEYAESTQLHLDILPAIPDANSRKFLFENVNHYGDTAISITDSEHENYNVICDDWVKSNPRGYQKWFKEQMTYMLNESKQSFASMNNINIDDVPDYKVKTPLQRAVQLLKRHRDINCIDNDDKPISIIITTLAAKAYSNEENLFEAILSILRNMINYIEIEIRNGVKVKVISNPVDNRENFADKWELYPEREIAFYKWHKTALEFFSTLLKNNDIRFINESLKSGFGSGLVKKTFVEMGEQTYSNRDKGLLRMASKTGVIGTNLIKEESKKINKHLFHGNKNN
jgi:hypothetical protein